MYLLRNSVWCALVIALLSAACERKPEQRVQAFYNLDSLIDMQVQRLVEMQPSLEKEALINGESERVVLQDLDSTMWARELEIFRQLDLNEKTLNATQYQGEYGLRDATSNLAIIQYTAMNPLPLSYVRIYYQETPGKVRRIEGEIFEENRLYSSGRFLSMEFIDVNDGPAVVGYEIRGAQKMILADSMKFVIKGTLTYD
ncbi:MAG: hypothetical protein LOY03_13520 [Cyclobacteriaceae bacterium]|jgi:hypothetical protein|nr:hypothetical protein [Cyclobacteriaceae bacterium]